MEEFCREARGLGAKVEWLALHRKMEISSAKTEFLIMGAEMAGYRIVSGTGFPGLLPYGKGCERIEDAGEGISTRLSVLNKEGS